MGNAKKRRTLVITEKGEKWVESQREQIESATGMTLEAFSEKVGKGFKEIREEIDKEGLMAVVLKYR